MSLVTRGLGGSNLVTRGYGGGVSTIPRVYPETIDARPLLYPPDIVLTAVGVTAPALTVPVTIYEPRVQVGVNVPNIVNGATVLDPTMYQITPVGVPTIAVPATLYQPTVTTTVAAPLPTIFNPAALYAPTVKPFNYVLPSFPTVAPVIHAPQLYTTYTVGVPTIVNAATFYLPHVAFDQFVQLPELVQIVQTLAPNVAYGDLLDYVDFALGIVQDTDLAMGIVTYLASLAGIKQTGTYAVGIEATPGTETVTDTVIEFNLGIAQTTDLDLGLRETYETPVGIAQEAAENLTQTLDY